MKYRISSITVTGFGSSSTPLLFNNGKLLQAFCDASVEEFFKKHEGFDFQIEADHVLIGIEPSYMYDPLLIICIHSNKNMSFVQNGKAWGAYGSNIVKRTKYYHEYRNSCKFTKFIDKWSITCPICGDLIISHDEKCRDHGDSLIRK